MNRQRLLQLMIGVTLTALFVSACAAPPTGAPIPPTAMPTPVPATATTIPSTATPTPLPPTPTPTPVPEPKAGLWTGKDVSFTVTKDGRIQDLTLSFPFAGGTCTYTIEDVPIANMGFEYSVKIKDAAIATFAGTFETETTLSASYSVLICEGTASMQLSPEGKFDLVKGRWTASWQQP